MPSFRQPGDDLLGLPGWREGTSGELVPKDVRAVLGIEIAVEERNLARSSCAELVALIGDTVPIGIAQGHHAAAAERDEHVAVRRDDEMARLRQAVGEDRCAEP